MIYLTSDLHFGHNVEFMYKPRGFSSIEEHDNAIVRRWNEVVTDDDTVYILGDLMLGDNTYGIGRLRALHGKKYFITGNHDTDNRVSIYESIAGITPCGYSDVMKYLGYRFYLSHYPTLTGNLEAVSLKKTTINLYGHTHQKTNFFEDRPYMYHVGMDSHDCTPVSLDRIIDEINEKVKYCLEQ